MKSDCLYHTKLLYADILTQAHSQRLQNHPQLSAPMCPGMAASAVSLTKSYDIVILSFCNIVKGQAKRTCHLEIMNITFTYVLGYTFTFCSTLANVRTHQVLIWTIRNIISIMWQPNNKIWVSYHLDLLNGCFEVI